MEGVKTKAIEEREQHFEMSSGKKSLVTSVAALPPVEVAITRTLFFMNQL